MSVRDLLMQFESFMPIELLEQRLELSLRFLPEPIIDIIGSTTVAADGLSLPRVLLVTENYLVDIAMALPHLSASFDYVLRNTIRNIRCELSLMEVKEGDVVKETYQIAKVDLMHSIGAGLVTALTYAGTNRNEWLERTLSVFPVKALV